MMMDSALLALALAGATAGSTTPKRATGAKKANDSMDS